MEQNLKQKDLALITSVIINEDILGGTIFQTFDKAYALAKKFQVEFSHDFNWENQRLDFDEAIILFTKQELGIIPKEDDGRSYGYVTIRLIDFTDGKNQEKQYNQDFDVIETLEDSEDIEVWLNNNYPDAVKHTGRSTSLLFGKDWVTNNKHISIHIRDPHSNGWNNTYIIPNKSINKLYKL
jgi:hypothetical protein